MLLGRGPRRALAALEKLRLALEEDPPTANIERFSDAQERFEIDGGYAAESEVRRLVDGLGLRADRLDLTLGALSGGERRRLELARILFGGSDLLLLDEPTNHLDADARDWLLKFLRQYRGALLVISHDLDLLDEAITRVIHLDREAEEARGKLVEYKGTYSQYLAARERDEERLAKSPRAGGRDRPAVVLADSMRGQTAKRARVAKNLDPASRQLEAGADRGPTKRRRSTCASPTRRRAGAPCSPPPSCGSPSARSTCSPT